MNSSRIFCMGNNFSCLQQLSLRRSLSSGESVRRSKLYKFEKKPLFRRQQIPAQSCLSSLYKHRPLEASFSHLFKKNPYKTLVYPHQNFHTTPRRNIPPFVWLFVKPLAKLMTVLTSRSARKWWKALPADEKKGVYKHIYNSKSKIFAVLALVLGFGVVNVATHLDETPITKRRRYIAFTPSQFMKIAQFEYEQKIEEAKPHMVKPSHPVYDIITNIATKIVDANQDIDFMKEQTWTVIVVDSPEANAFVLPTGHIFVYTGLVKVCQNIDQLAVVLGHEMAHAVLGHGAEIVSYGQVLDVMVIMAMAAIWFFMPSDGVALVTQWFYNKVTQLLLHLPYSRKLEKEADEVGLQLVAKACYDVREGSTFWNLMTVWQEHANAGEEDDTPQWLSTHPSNDTRAQNLDDLVPKAMELMKLCKCPELSQEDPRQRNKALKQILNYKKTPANAQKPGSRLEVEKPGSRPEIAMSS